MAVMKLHIMIVCHLCVYFVLFFFSTGELTRVLQTGKVAFGLEPYN